MDREYYNSLQEAYQQIEEQGQRKIKRNVGGVDLGGAVKAVTNALKAKPTGGSRNRFDKPTPKPTPAATTTPTPKVTTPATSTSTSTGRMADPVRKPQAASTPAPAPKPQPRQSSVSGTSASGSPIKTSDVQARNAATADRAAKVRAAGGDPTAGGEFKTKVTDTGSARLNKALSGIGKWNEEELLDYANTLVEQNYCDTVESALIVLQHLSPEALDEALG